MVYWAFVSICNLDKGNCLICLWSIRKPICDFGDGGFGIGNGVANIGVVDEIGIDHFDYTFNVCNCWCYNNHYDKTDILINNHWPFVVACDTKN